MWAVVTDVDRWASWDPHEQEARLDGPFVAGGTGWSKPHGGPATAWTITEVVDGHRWSSRCGLPGGGLTGENVFEPVGAGREIADQAGADRMMTSKLMRTLEERDLVTRRTHETDARAVRVALTPAGRGLVEQATGLAREVDTMLSSAPTRPRCAPSCAGSLNTAQRTTRGSRRIVR